MNDVNTTDQSETETPSTDSQTEAPVQGGDQPLGNSVASSPGPVDPPTEAGESGSDGGSDESSSEDDDGSADAGPEPKDPNDGVDPDAEQCETPDDLLEDDTSPEEPAEEARTLSEVLGDARAQRKLVDSGSQRLG